MKKLFLTTSLLLVSFVFLSLTVNEKAIEKENITTYKSKFDEGFEDGHCEGWKDEKGSYAICPIAPIPPIPTINQSSNSYRDGYNTGFKRGIRDARRN